MTADELLELAFLVRLDAVWRAARCTGKDRFQTRGQALQAVTRRMARYGCHPYRCNMCGAWHVGTTIAPKAMTRDADRKNASHRRHV